MVAKLNESVVVPFTVETPKFLYRILARRPEGGVHSEYVNFSKGRIADTYIAALERAGYEYVCWFRID